MVQYIHHTEQSRSIEIKNLSFSYRDSPRLALKEINLEIGEGEFVVLMGRSGAGKSTLAKCANSTIPQFQKGNFNGEVKIFGKEISKTQVYQTAETVGLLLQDFECQLFSTNVVLEVAFGLENFAFPKEEIKKRVKESLAIVGLSGYEKRDPMTLSGGEKQKLALASILALQPKILILDEPTTDLDPSGKEEIFNLIASLTAKGLTVLVIEHETEKLFSAERMVILNQGKIVLEGKAGEIFSRVNLLETNGIRPPQILKLLSHLNLNLNLISVDEAYKLLKENGYKISEEKYTYLLEKEKNEKEVLFRIKNLGYTYPDGSQVLKGINLEIKEGEFLAIVGANGSGKTTLIKHFNHLFEPSEGEIFYRDTNLKELKISRLGREIGYLFQNPDNQIFASTVKEEIAFGLKNLAYPESQIEEKVKTALRSVQLKGYEEFDPFILTKGEKQRLAVASVLATQPKVIILDEPTTGLDFLELKSLMDILKELNQKGHTIIMVTHTMWLVAEYAKRAVVLDQGGVVFAGRVRDLFREEEKLKSYKLEVPPLIQLSNRLGQTSRGEQGRTLLSVDEFLFCMERR